MNGNSTKMFGHDMGKIESEVAQAFFLRLKMSKDNNHTS